MRARWEEEPTGLIPRLTLARLCEESKPPPKRFVVTISKTPFPPSRDDDFLAEEPPTIAPSVTPASEPPIRTIEIPIDEDNYAVAAPAVAPRTYGAIATMLVAAVITVGACLVVGMLFS